MRLGSVTALVLLTACMGYAEQNSHKHKEAKMKFACALECMDGRPKDAATKHIKEKYSVDAVDSITEPGMVRVLADNLDDSKIESIKSKLAISVNHHGSRLVAIVAHPHCAGNPVEKKMQVKELHKAKRIVEAFGFKIKVVLLWVEDDWKTVEEIGSHVLAEAI